MPCESHARWSPARGAGRARPSRSPVPSSTSSAAVGATEPISPSSTSSFLPRPAVVISSACAHRRAPGARPGDRGEPDLRARRRVSSNRSTSTSSACAGSRPRGARMVHRVDGPIGVYRGYDDGPTSASSSSTARWPTPPCSSRATASRSTSSSGSSSEPGGDPQLRRPGDLPSAGCEGAAVGAEAADRRHELVGQPAQGRRHAALARRASRRRAPRADVRRAHLGRVRACARRGPRRVGAAGRASPRPRRLHRREPRRPLLERAARGARVRAPRGVPAQRGPSRARRRGWNRVRRAGGAAGCARPARGEIDERRAAIRLCRSPRWPTAISRCCTGEDCPAAPYDFSPTSCTRARGGADTWLASRTLDSSSSATVAAGRSTTKPSRSR